MSDREDSLAGSLQYQTGPRYGAWDGEVRSVKDPTRSGLVRVRIFMLHGDEESTPDAALPWAEVSWMGGGYDWGEFDPPPVGTKILVMFRMGNEDQPIVIGCTRGTPTEQQKMRAKSLGESEPLWTSPAKESETPKDAFQDSEDGDNQPHVKVWRKSFKGHTIEVGEEDGNEFMKVIDRIGQVIEFSCPVTEEENETIAAQRGTSDASRNTQFDAERLVKRRGYIRLVDVSGQELILDGRAGNEVVRLRNKNKSGSREQTIEMSNKAGQEYIDIKDQSGNLIRLASAEEKSILIRDRKGTEVSMDAADGNLIVSPTVDMIEIIKRNRNTSVGGTVYETVGGSRKLTVGNHSELNAGGSLMANAIGDGMFNFGGAVNVMIGGVPLSGVPGMHSLKVTTSLGGMGFQSFVPGLFVIANGIDPTGLLAANMNSFVMTPAGTSGLFGAVTTQIGRSAITAVHPAVVGTSHVAAMSAFLSVVSAAGKACTPDPSGTAASTFAQAVAAAADTLAGALAGTLSTSVLLDV